MIEAFLASRAVTTAKNFILSPWGLGIILAAGLVLAGTLIYLSGDNNGSARVQGKWDAEKLLRSVQTELVEAQQETAVAPIAAATEAAQVQIRWKTKFLKEKVPSYVTPTADSKCVVPDGFVRLYNESVSDDPPAPEPPGFDPDADSGVALSTVSETDLHNIGVCKSLRAEVIAWRSWYETLQAVRAVPVEATTGPPDLRPAR